MESKKEKRPPRRSGLTSPLDIFQILSWLFYFLCSSFVIYAIIKHQTGWKFIIWTSAKSLLSLAVITSTIMSVFSDPTDENFYEDPKPETENNQSPHPTTNRTSLGYCEYCEKIVLKESKHCKRCDRCIREFDHHCRFVNQCVGVRNYKTFFTLVSILSLDLCTMSAFVIIDSIYFFRYVPFTKRRKFGLHFSRDINHGCDLFERFFCGKTSVFPHLLMESRHDHL